MLPRAGDGSAVARQHRDIISAARGIPNVMDIWESAVNLTNFEIYATAVRL